MIELDVKAQMGEFQLKAKFETSGQITALFGPSGSGKTSLIRLIAGLENPDNGSIIINQQTVFDSARHINLAPRLRRIGYVFQNANLFPHFSVRRNLRYAQWAGKRQSGFEFDKVCEVLGIGHLLERRAHALSGGEKQRVAIGRALLSDPAILLLDEPLSALDTKRKLEIIPFLENVRDEFAIEMIYISHSLDEVTRLANHLVVFEEGEVVSNGDIEQVLATLDLRGIDERREAGSLITGQFEGFDEENCLAHILLEGQSIFLPMPNSKLNGLVRIRVRANDISLALNPPQNTSIQNMLRCKISRIEIFDKSLCDVSLLLGSQVLRARITRKSAKELRLKEGMACIALLKSVALDSYSEARTS